MRGSFWVINLFFQVYDYNEPLENFCSVSMLHESLEPDIIDDK